MGTRVFAGVQRGAAKGQADFVYLRNWVGPKCTEFEDNVRGSRAVVDATAPMVCVQLEHGLSARFVEHSDLPDPPFAIVLEPDDRVRPPLSSGALAQKLSVLSQSESSDSCGP